MVKYFKILLAIIYGYHAIQFWMHNLGYSINFLSSYEGNAWYLLCGGHLILLWIIRDSLTINNSRLIILIGVIIQVIYMAFAINHWPHQNIVGYLGAICGGVTIITYIHYLIARKVLLTPLFLLILGSAFFWGAIIENLFYGKLMWLTFYFLSPTIISLTLAYTLIFNKKTLNYF